jgi:hypothetical protein
MIPMLHTANHRTAAEGLGLIEPMYYAYPDSPDAYEAKGQYIFAGDYIVAPITKRSDDSKLSAVNVWIPEGKWTDLFTNDVYNIEMGGKWVTLVRPLDSIPVLAKSGAVLPLSNDKGNSVDNPSDLEFEVYNGNNTYRLYEDNEKGIAAYTVVENKEASGKETVKLSFEGEFSVLPKKRDITLTFKNIVVNTPVDMVIGLAEKRYAKVTVTKNGKETNAKVSKYDTVRVKITDVDYNAEYEIEVEYSEMPELCGAKRDALMKLLTAEGAFVIRNDLDKKIRRVDSIESIVCSVRNSDISSIEKARLIETFNI